MLVAFILLSVDSLLQPSPQDIEMITKFVKLADANGIMKPPAQYYLTNACVSVLSHRYTWHKFVCLN